MKQCLHDYMVVNESNDGILEVCKLCKKKVKTSKDRRTGRIDNRKYLKDHERDFIQREDKRYEKIYGKATDPYKENKDLVESIKEEADETYHREMEEIKRDETSSKKLIF